MRSTSATTRWSRAAYWSSPPCSWRPIRWWTSCMASSTHVFASVSPAPATRPPLSGLPRRVISNQAAAIGLAIVAIYILLGLSAEWLPLRSPLQIVGANRMAGPNWSMPLGADTFGRDLLSRIVFGARLSLQVAVLSVALALVAGSALGLIAGYAGGWLDQVIMRSMDVLFAFPAVLLALGVVRALGARASRIITLHVLPNLLSVLIVQTSIALSWAVLTEASLSFLGLSAQPPAPSWGAMLNEGRQNLELAPHLAIFPGLAIMLAVLGFNLLGDGLRDVLDPRLRR